MIEENIRTAIQNIWRTTEPRRQPYTGELEVLESSIDLGNLLSNITTVEIAARFAKTKRDTAAGPIESSENTLNCQKSWIYYG
jgi:hypothetical protein